MYNILIVDDEELICEGLKSMIERGNHDEIGELWFISDPGTVEKFIEKEKVDIIITDIQMPGMSGLDLIKKVSGLNSSIKFIALSGHDDFIYVKEAFKLGVVDYLLKPGTIDEIMAVIDKVITRIKDEDERTLIAENKTYRYMEAVLENKLNRIFAGTHKAGNNIERLFQEINISFPYSQFCIGAVSYQFGTFENEDIKNLRVCLDEVGKSLVNGREAVIFYFYNYNNNLVLIFNTSKEIDYEGIKKYLLNLMSMFENNKNTPCYASLSEVFDDITRIISGYNHAMEALAYKIVYEPNTIIRYSDIVNKIDNKRMNPINLGKFKELILKYKAAEFSDSIDAFFDKETLKNSNLYSIERLYNNLTGKINEIIMENELLALENKFLEFNSFNSISEIKIHIKSLVYQVIALLREKDKGRTISDIVKKYVNENYNKDIDMAVVSNMVSLSYSHFSKVFKDETGMNFSDYLVKVRMEKALLMLQDPTNRIHDIAQNVGYSNPKHFTRTFKNHFGFSPSIYRESPEES